MNILSHASGCYPLTLFCSTRDLQKKIEELLLNLLAVFLPLLRQLLVTKDDFENHFLPGEKLIFSSLILIYVFLVILRLPGVQIDNRILVPCQVPS